MKDEDSLSNGMSNVIFKKVCSDICKYFHNSQCQSQPLRENIGPTNTFDWSNEVSRVIVFGGFLSMFLLHCNQILSTQF